MPAPLPISDEGLHSAAALPFIVAPTPAELRWSLECSCPIGDVAVLADLLLLLLLLALFVRLLLLPLPQVLLLLLLLWLLPPEPTFNEVAMLLLLLLVRAL